MVDFQYARWVRDRRLALGFSQSELARRCQTSDTAISAIESGKRAVGPTVQRKLAQALEERPSRVLERNRAAVLAAAERLGISNVMVFGSIAKGVDRLDSDIDLLITVPRGKGSAFRLLDFQNEVERILGVSVDVVSRSERPELAGRTLRDANEYAIAL